MMSYWVFTNIYSLSLSSCDLHIFSHLSSSLLFLIHRARQKCCVFKHTPPGPCNHMAALLAIRLALQQILQVTLVNSAIGLCVAAQFGSRVTCSCHVAVALKDLLAIPYRWPNLGVRTLVLHGRKTATSFYLNSTCKWVFFQTRYVLGCTDQLCRCDL